MLELPLTLLNSAFAPVAVLPSSFLRESATACDRSAVSDFDIGQDRKTPNARPRLTMPGAKVIYQGGHGHGDPEACTPLSRLTLFSLWR